MKTKNCCVVVLPENEPSISTEREFCYTRSTMFHHHVSTVTQNGQTKHQLYSGPFCFIHNREIIDCVCSSKCPVNSFTDSSGITAVYGEWLYPGLKDTFMSITHPKLQPKFRWSSCILGNVGPRFLQGRMYGMRKRISSID